MLKLSDGKLERGQECSTDRLLRSLLWTKTHFSIKAHEFCLLEIVGGKLSSLILKAQMPRQ